VGMLPKVITSSLSVEKFSLGLLSSEFPSGTDLRQYACFVNPDAFGKGLLLSGLSRRLQQDALHKSCTVCSQLRFITVYLSTWSI